MLPNAPFIRHLETLPDQLKRGLLAKAMDTFTRAEYDRVRSLTKDPSDILIFVCAEDAPWANSVQLVADISPAEHDPARAHMRALGLPPTYPLAVTRASLRDGLANVPEHYVDAGVRDVLAFPRLEMIRVVVVAFGGVSCLEARV